jgi:hypothetical protein
MKLSYSRMPFVRAYFRETQELVFDAHDKAFQFYGGVCRRGIYDNMKTAVKAIFVGKARQYNRRFLQMCSHIEPVACTPASGWEKGQVENKVGNLQPKPRVKSLAELNAGLEDQCIACAKRTKHPEFKDRTVWGQRRAFPWCQQLMIREWLRCWRERFCGGNKQHCERSIKEAQLNGKRNHSEVIARPMVSSLENHTSNL